MSKNEKKNNVVVAKKENVSAIVSKVVTNKDAYDKCFDLMSVITKAYNDIIVICNDDSNTLPTSTVNRIEHLLGKAEGSKQQQFVTAYGSIVKRQEKAKNSLIAADKKQKKAKEKHAELIKSLSPEQKKELAKELSGVKM